MTRHRSSSTKRQREQARKNRQETKAKRRAERIAAREAAQGRPAEGISPESGEDLQETVVPEQRTDTSGEAPPESPSGIRTDGIEPPGESAGGTISPAPSGENKTEEC